jgi:hypothetical protein
MTHIMEKWRSVMNDFSNYGGGAPGKSTLGGLEAQGCIDAAIDW